MADRAIARRYATAFIELAAESRQIDALGADLGKALASCRANQGQLLDLLANPVFTLDERGAVLAAVLPRLGLNPLTANLLRLLLDKGRFGLLAEVVEAYEAFADERAGRVRVHVKTAEPLTPQLEAELRMALEKSTGKSVLLASSVDPSLIGGMTATLGDTVYDASARARLERLRQVLLSTQPPAEA